MFKELFSTDEAIEKYLVEASKLLTDTGNACAGMTKWR
jgi:hypothetical protein